MVDKEGHRELNNIYWSGNWFEILAYACRNLHIFCLCVLNLAYPDFRTEETKDVVMVNECDQLTA